MAILPVSIHIARFPKGLEGKEQHGIAWYSIATGISHLQRSRFIGF